MNIQEENSARYFRVQSEHEQTLVVCMWLFLELSNQLTKGIPCIPDLIQSYYLIFVIVTIGKRFRHKVDNYLSKVRLNANKQCLSVPIFYQA